MQKTIWSINERGTILVDFIGDQERFTNILRVMIRQNTTLAATLTGVVLEFWTAAGVDCGDLKKMVMPQP
jgi:hypothetical protein